MRHFRTLFDVGTDLPSILKRGHAFKKLRGHADAPRPLEGKSVALIFEKASTRTRLSFEVGVHELGGRPLVVMARDSQLGRGEPLSDTALMLGEYVHMVMYRTFGHDRIETLAAANRIPVINGLSDLYHPCQLIADLLTMQEEFGADLSQLSVAWIGDGNNMAHSWLNAAALMGFELRLASPVGYQVNASVLAAARARGARVVLTETALQACEGAHVVTTDVWSSMGQESEQAVRAVAFANYCVGAQHMRAARPEAIFLHCLPAHRGEEVTAEVIDGPASRVAAEAGFRLHGQKAVMEWLTQG